jgi:hypothetical protein
MEGGRKRMWESILRGENEREKGMEGEMNSFFGLHIEPISVHHSF